MWKSGIARVDVLITWFIKPSASGIVYTLVEKMAQGELSLIRRPIFAGNVLHYTS